MLRVNRHFVWSTLLIFVLVLNLLNVRVAFADDSTPPPPTEETSSPPVEPTEAPVTEATPGPTETIVSQEAVPPAENPPPAEEELAGVLQVLQELPDNTEIVVLDENGNVIPLGSQSAAEIILDTDPMWCPVIAGVPTSPGGAGCTTNFATGQALIDNMDSSNPATTNSTYERDGIIYFTANPGGSFALVPGSGNAIDTNDYNALKGYNLTLRGGWNGSTASPAFSGQSNFGSNTLTIGASGNPWVGSITLTDFTFSGVSSSNAVTVYTTTGNITLNNVDVAQQSGTNYTALLDSNSGNITVQNGSSFDGNNSGSNQNRGFNAHTNTGTISISNTSFTEANGCFVFFICLLPTVVNYDGATLTAPTVTLNNVTASNNDLNGIVINNAALVTLTNVNASNNGTDLLLSPDSGDLGSGVRVNGTGATIVNITGGTFSNNERYGLEVLNGIMSGVGSIVSCTGNDLGCTPDNTPPVLTLPATILVEAAGNSGEVVMYSATALDAVDGTRPVSCSPASGSTFFFGTTTVNCSSSDTSGNTANGSFTVIVRDTTPPTISPMPNISMNSLKDTGEIVTYTNPATYDLVDGAGVASCSPVSGSQFAPGNTIVTCSATDSHGNTASITFSVHINYNRSGNLPGTSNGFILVTGGELIDLECFSVVNAFGVVVKFHNLCDRQAALNEVPENALPGALPAGFTFVQGLNVDILEGGQLLDILPNDSGVEMDFTHSDDSEFAVLFWNEGEWVEITQLMEAASLESVLATDADNELYLMSSSNAAQHKVLTTEKTGAFVLVKK